ncbi:MAG: putative Ig domain-containing protein [Chthoniobacterales bacterium]
MRSPFRAATSAIALLLVATIGSATAFSLTGKSWAIGSQIEIHLGLNSRFAVPLQDGSASWNASVSDALAIWNQYLVPTKLVAEAAATPGQSDGVNSAFFASDIYGDTWPTGALAVTLDFSTAGSSLTEKDVIFNNNLKWNSYRGPVQGSGQTGTWDVHRVALHEFGHVIGLDHPNEHGQTVVAIMNSIISDLDHLADDDIAGARLLYELRVTSGLTPSPGEIGISFSYQVGANNLPAGYEAAGLPPGLTLDAASGLISGVPTQSGTFTVTLIVHGSLGDVTATLPIQITPRRITSALSAAVDIGGVFSYSVRADNNPTTFDAYGLPSGLKFNPATGTITGVPELSGTYNVTIVAHGALGDATGVLRLVVNAVTPPIPLLATLSIESYTGLMLTDPKRSQIYVASTLGITVIDTNTLKIKANVPVSGSLGDMAISADGNRLWLAYGISSDAQNKVRSIDLTTLTALPDLPIAMPPVRIREGLNGRLYVSSFQGRLASIDIATGNTLSDMSTGLFAAALAISPDRSVLFVGAENPSPGAITKYDVSSPTPQVLQAANTGGYGQYLSLSNTGKYIGLPSSAGPTPDGTIEFSASDLNKTFGTLQMNSVLRMAFSPDDSLVYQIGQQANYVGIYDAANCQLLRKLDLGATSYAHNITTDATGSRIFVMGGAFSGSYSFWVRVYGANPPPPTPPHSLLNISTRLATDNGDNALIGGFIINGLEQKKLVLRAIGPSLPLPGKLADPVLQLFDAGGLLVGENDNWNAHRPEILATNIAPLDEHEAAMAVTLQPGSYTAMVRGVSGSSGVVLVEAYDLSPSSNSKLANISTRGKVDGGDNVMIAGFIVGGTEATSVAVRAIGPSLTSAGVPGVLSDPTLEVHDGNGVLLAQDDDWRMYQEQLLIDTGLAPTDDHEAAMILWLQPGPYTAIVRGKNNTTGVGLVEVYNLQTN